MDARSPSVLHSTLNHQPSSPVTAPDARIARQLGRTESAVKSRRAILEREQARRKTKRVISDPKPSCATFAALHPAWRIFTTHSNE